MIISELKKISRNLRIVLRKDQIGCYKYWKAPIQKTNHLVPQLEHVERNLLEKNWKTPLNKDDNRQIYSFFSLIGAGSFNIKQEKDNIRSYVALKRSELSDTEVELKSSQISAILSSLELFIHSKRVALYSPILNEVQTQVVFYKSIELEKEVYFPRVDGSSLDFCRISNLEQLKKGNFGVLEPEDHLHKADLQEIDLFIIPGLAFDKSGNRLGYGKGYYDRALVNIPENKKIGICFNLQMLDEVPTTRNDQKVGTVITEMGIVFSRRNIGGE